MIENNFEDQEISTLSLNNTYLMVSDARIIISKL